jgi:cytoskeletal protein RodZ
MGRLQRIRSLDYATAGIHTKVGSAAAPRRLRDGRQDVPTSFGAELRRERELRQISLREVAQATKINLRYLEALERNDFAYLPGGLFNRGFVRAYCEHIGVDPEAMVNAYLLEEQAQASPGGDRDSRLWRGPRKGLGPAREAGAPAEPQPAVAVRPGRRRGLRLVLAALLLAAASAALLWWLFARSGVPS